MSVLGRIINWHCLNDLYTFPRIYDDPSIDQPNYRFNLRPNNISLCSDGLIIFSPSVTETNFLLRPNNGIERREDRLFFVFSSLGKMNGAATAEKSEPQNYLSLLGV